MSERAGAKLGARVLLCWRLAARGLVFAALPALGVLGCASGLSESQSTGSLAMRLSTDVNGVEYRLRDAIFAISGPELVVLSSEGDPGAPFLRHQLVTGDYVLDLQPGWRLERGVGDTFETVQAQLISANPAAFSIDDGQTTNVSYAFETDGTIITFGHGDLVISIEVVDHGDDPGASGLSLRPNADGFIVGVTNDVGVQGAFFTAHDDGAGGSVIAPANFAGLVPPDGRICVQGEAAQVPQDPATGEFLFAQYWGALVGFNLSQPSDPATGMPTPVPQPYNPVTPVGTVVGISFKLSGPTLPAAFDMRLSTPFPGSTGQFCLPLGAITPVAGRHSFLFEAQTQDCWQPGGQPFTPGPLLGVHWQIVTNPSAPVPFDFCIEDMRAVLGP